MQQKFHPETQKNVRAFKNCQERLEVCLGYIELIFLHT